MSKTLKAKTLNNEPISKELQKKIDNNFSKYIGKVELIEKIREEIKAEILSKLTPKNKAKWGSENQTDYIQYEHGFNSCLSQVKEIIKKI